MNTMHGDPFRGLEDLSSRRNRLPGHTDLTRRAPSEPLIAADWCPAVDIAETAEEFLVKVECPSVNKDDIKVAVEHGLLRISGERKHEQEETAKLHRVERVHGSFLRIFALPDNVDQATITAEHRDGVLRVHLLKSDNSVHKTVEVEES